VYRIDDVSGRFYIGSSVNLGKRWRHHQYRLARGNHPNPILQSIWNVDPARLSFTALQAVDGTRAALLAAEQDALNAAGVGANRMCMNVLPVAGSHLGRKRSAETRSKLSAANIGKKATEAAKAKMRAAKLGKQQTAEHRRNSSLSRSGVKINRKPGGNNPKVRRFTDDQVRTMRAMKAAGKSYSKIEVDIGISHGGLQKIIERRTYRDVI
jgi:group I intron endonuclease